MQRMIAAEADDDVGSEATKERPWGPGRFPSDGGADLRTSRLGAAELGD
jgi:hypothetical protein